MRSTLDPTASLRAALGSWLLRWNLRMGLLPVNHRRITQWLALRVYRWTPGSADGTAGFVETNQQSLRTFIEIFALDM